MTGKRYVIIGAGAAGLSLCHALLERGITDDIVILDRKAAFSDDRTWCFWNTAPHPYQSIASHCWHRWDVIDTESQIASQSSVSVSYNCLHGVDFYNSVMSVIERSPHVTLKLGSPVENYCSHEGSVSITAGGQTWEADYVFDSRPRPLFSGRLSFSQRFFGQVIRSDIPAFDSTRPTLMDFRVSQAHGLHFLYVLPFSSIEALVENTYITHESAETTTAEQHRSEIQAYLAANYVLPTFTVHREEAGAIPMTPQSFPKRDGSVFYIGTAGGCTKPSSGYTFTRIQDQCRQIADAVASNQLETFREETPSPRYRFFDTVFLQALKDHPEAFPGYFHRLFTKVSPEVLTAFLSETSSWRSDLQILRSLPLKPFFQAALRSAPIWAGRQP